MHFTLSKIIIQFFRLSIRGGGGEDADINIILKKRFEKKEKGGVGGERQSCF
jgi:hypothetical protein